MKYEIGDPVWVWFAEHWQLRVISSRPFEQSGGIWYFTDHTHYRLDAFPVKAIRGAGIGSKKPETTPFS
jgi:hypothetical protein